MHQFVEHFVVAAYRPRKRERLPYKYSRPALGFTVYSRFARESCIVPAGTVVCAFFRPQMLPI